MAIELSKQARADAIASIERWFREERDEKIGNIAAGALNLCDDEDEALLQGGPAARECAARTLRLCQALGWTPARVWATPAIEVDRLLRMLDLVQPSAAAPRPAGRRSLADHPDATLIRIDDDPQERA